MNRFSTAAAAATLALIAAPAFAQSAAPSQDDQTAAPAQAAPSDQGSMNADPSMAAPSASASGVNTGAIVYQSSPTPADQAYALKAGDPTVVSNAPVPDTKANRARYGRPLSMTGRKTTAAGN